MQNVPARQPEVFAGQSGRVRRVAAALLLILALCYFGVRGVARGVVISRDLSIGYSAARALIAGKNPFDYDVMNQQLVEGRAVGLQSYPGPELPNVYFPSTLPVFLPLAAFDWPTAKLLWLAANLACSMLVPLGCLRLLNWRGFETPSLLLSAFWFALAPLHTSVAVAQMGVAATAAIVWAMLLERNDRPGRAGVLYGLAVCLKAQIGLPFLVYLLWKRRWRTASVAIALLGLSTLLAVARMESSGADWINALEANFRGLTFGGGADATSTGTTRHHLVNLHYLVHTIVDDRLFVSLFVGGLLLAAALATVALIPGRRPARELLAMSLVSVICLLGVYHRAYDAVLLALPMTWAFHAFYSGARWHGAAALLLCADFILPSQAMAKQWQDDGKVPAWVVDSAVWQDVVLTQHVWAISLLGLVLLSAAWKGRKEDRV